MLHTLSLKGLRWASLGKGISINAKLTLNNKQKLIIMKDLSKFADFRKLLPSIKNDKKKLLRAILSLLYVNQRECFLQQLAILEKGPSCCNVTDRGGGKTLITCLVSIYLDLPMHIHCNKNISSQWVDEADRISATIAEILPFSQVRGKGIVRHPYLFRDGIHYEETEYLVNCMKEGRLVVIDEIQEAKNEGRLLQASLNVISRAAFNSGNSKIVLCSASPFDKPECATVLGRLSGIMCNDPLINENGEWSQSFHELLNYCYSIHDPNEVNKAISSYMNYVTEENGVQIAFILTTQFLGPPMTVCAPKSKSRQKHSMENVFFKLEGNGFKEANEINGKYNRMIGLYSITRDKNILHKAQNSYDEESELVKSKEIIVPLTIAIREVIPTAKFPIFVTYHDSSDHLLKAFERLFPGKVGVLNGDTPKRERSKIKNKFAEDNDDMMILIGCPSVCGAGSELDDKHGGRPRIILHCPGRNFIHTYQIDGRIDRVDTKSESWTVNIYIDNIPREYAKFDKSNEKVSTTQSSLAGKRELNYNSDIIHIPSVLNLMAG